MIPDTTDRCALPSPSFFLFLSLSLSLSLSLARARARAFPPEVRRWAARRRDDARARPHVRRMGRLPLLAHLVSDAVVTSIVALVLWRCSRDVWGGVLLPPLLRLLLSFVCGSPDSVENGGALNRLRPLSGPGAVVRALVGRLDAASCRTRILSSPSRTVRAAATARDRPPVIAI